MSDDSKRPKENKEDSVTLTALTVEGDCILDFCLKWDFYDSGYCETNEVFSVLIVGGPRWLCH